MSKEKKHKFFDNSDKVLVGAMIGNAATLAVSPLLLTNEFKKEKKDWGTPFRRPIKDITKAYQTDLTKYDIEGKSVALELADWIKANDKLDLVKIVSEPYHIAGPAYDHTTRSVYHGYNKNNLGTMAHELGHAIDFKNKSMGHMYLRGLPFAGLMGSYLMAKDEDLRPYAPLPLLASSAPMLYQEGKASYLGLDRLKKFLAEKYPSAKNLELLRNARRDLTGAFGTYAAAAVLPVAGIYITNKLIDRKS